MSWDIFKVAFQTVFILVLTLSGHLIRAHIINTRSGSIEGVVKVARNHKYFHAYYGIPYAKPPVGQLRFEPPVEAGSWSGVFNATKQPLPCPQWTNSEVYTGEEDCLVLHIYTPTNVKPGSNIPVLFYIFGGVFRKGDPLKKGPEYIMSKEVILVMVNYRIGVLGFLSTGDLIIPGNMALKDQTMAMKWIKENIYQFGGDPERITIHGHSSGAVCVHLHTLSPLSKDYFNQAIIQSGLGVNPQSFSDRDTANGMARALAERVNCSMDSSEALKECLQRKEAKELVLAANDIKIWQQEPEALFRPVIEDKNAENAFLTEYPLSAPYISNSKPWLLGITSDEAASYVSAYLNTNLDILNLDPKLLLPVLGCFEWTSKPNYVNFIAQWAKTVFFGEETIGDSRLTALVKMLNGIMHGYGLIDVLQKYPATKYVYLFDYRYIGNYASVKGNQYLGVGHANELPIIFKEPDKTGVTEEDLMFGDEIITRWVNFAYSGNPNVPLPINTSVFGVWNPVSSSRIEFLRIKEKGSMEKDYFMEEYGSWRKIPFFSKYR